MAAAAAEPSVENVREYLQECYVAAGDPSAAGRIQQRVESAVAEMAAVGIRVRLIRTILIPEDETWFLLWEAAGVDAVREAAVRAGIVCDRLTEVMPVPAAAPGGDQRLGRARARPH